MRESTHKVPYPWEVQIPKELEGWEEMYPRYYFFNANPERREFEKKHLWLHDKLHAAEPMYPLLLLFHDAWQITISDTSTRLWCIPLAQGWTHRVLGCYFYTTPVSPPPDDVVGEKSDVFRKRVLDFLLKEYDDEIWEKWLERVKEVAEEIRSIEVPKELPRFEPDEVLTGDPIDSYPTGLKLLEAFYKLVILAYRIWHFHVYLGPAYLALLSFTEVCKKLFPGISDVKINKMVAGVRVDMFKPQEELAKLARLALSLGERVREILKSDASPEEKIEELKTFPEGQRWLKAFEEAKDPWFYVSCGSGWFHYEGSWVERLEVPFEYLKGYINELESGIEIERPLERLEMERKKLVDEYRSLIKNEDDRRAFDETYELATRIYSFTENHIFWCEHYLHTIWYMKAREIGEVLRKHGVLANADDIFLFNWFEVPQMIYDLICSWAISEPFAPFFENWKKKAEKRKRILEAARKWTPPPMLGELPTDDEGNVVIADPFVILNYGISGERVGELLEGVSKEEVTEIRGIGASSGVAEGPARVVLDVEKIGEVKPGEILVCKYTNPSWAPVFTKIKAAVTDLGGLLTHAAIVCREYGLPAVVGTISATSKIRSGDIIRVDGDSGVVTILKKAE